MFIMSTALRQFREFGKRSCDPIRAATVHHTQPCERLVPQGGCMADVGLLPRCTRAPQSRGFHSG